MRLAVLRCFASAMGVTLFGLDGAGALADFAAALPLPRLAWSVAMRSITWPPPMTASSGCPEATTLPPETFSSIAARTRSRSSTGRHDIGDWSAQLRGAPDGSFDLRRQPGRGYVDDDDWRRRGWKGRLWKVRPKR